MHEFPRGWGMYARYRYKRKTKSRRRKRDIGYGRVVFVLLDRVHSIVVVLVVVVLLSYSWRVRRDSYDVYLPSLRRRCYQKSMRCLRSSAVVKLFGCIRWQAKTNLKRWLGCCQSPRVRRSSDCTYTIGLNFAPLSLRA